MLTLPRVLQTTAEQFGANTAIVDEECRLTWSEFVGRISRAASLIREGGVSAGERFGIIGTNSFRQAELIHAGYWSGAVPVPINYRLAAVEISQILQDADCRLLAIDPQFEQLLQAAPLSNWRDRCLMFSAAQDYEDAIRQASQTKPIDALPGGEALVIYTGGTSGRPKGVPLTHANIVANATQINAVWPASDSDVALHVAPMFHSAELCFNPFTNAGAAHAYLPRFSPQALFQAIQDYAVTSVLLVPTMVLMCVESGVAANYDLSSLRRIIYGSSPMSAELIKRTREYLPGVELAQGYGLTETAPLICILDNAAHIAGATREGAERLSSCGRPLPEVELKIIAADGAEAVRGDSGEVTVRGPNVFAGYLNQPALSSTVLHDGWFHTGDVGRLDAAGYLYIMDRKKDMIITGGENVYSGEVEAALFQHPGVVEAAAIGIADEHYGETVCAVVVRRDGADLTEGALIEHCRQRIGAYKLPRKVIFIEEMPKSAMGKILKAELRRMFAPARSHGGDSL